MTSKESIQKIVSVQQQTSEQEIKAVVQKKEETQHRYLRSLIKKVAGSKGYKATIEMPTLDKKGSVDVHIERDNFQIAYEVSVTTDSNWEIHNIQKCLAAEYDTVFVCCAERKSIDALQKRIRETFEEAIRSKVIVGEPENLFDLLDRNALEQVITETIFKGYRVKVEYDTLSQEEQKRKRDSVAKIVLESLRKMK